MSQKSSVLNQTLFVPLTLTANNQVTEFLRAFYKVAIDAGLPREKLYSHQIVSRVNSAWNPQLLAADGIIDGDLLPWHVGINLYGGATNSNWVRKFISQHHLQDYGVPEFNPQQWKKPMVDYDALASQYKSGARFVSPYYLSVVPDRMKQQGPSLNRMEIRPDNKRDGSDQFYQAIRDFARN